MTPRTRKRARQGYTEAHDDQPKDEALAANTAIADERRNDDDRESAEQAEYCEYSESTVSCGDKSILCHTYDKSRSGASSDGKKVSLIFTHGAGGGIKNAATADFVHGFARKSTAICFNGTMNLQNRVKYFRAVIEQMGPVKTIGGRSMGARAAVMAATQGQATITSLLLVSYPLTNAKGESREGVLLDIAPDVDVLFISGDKDEMCDLEHLNRVRSEMKARSWLVVVKDTDHGMNTSPKQTTERMRMKTGAVAESWLACPRDESCTEMELSWDPEDNQIVQSQWRGADSATRKRRCMRNIDD